MVPKKPNSSQVLLKKVKNKIKIRKNIIMFEYDDDYLADYLADRYGSNWYTSHSLNKRIDSVMDLLNTKSNLYKCLDVLKLSELSVEQRKYWCKELYRLYLHIKSNLYKYLDVLKLSGLSVEHLDKRLDVDVLKLSELSVEQLMYRRNYTDLLLGMNYRDISRKH